MTAFLRKQAQSIFYQLALRRLPKPFEHISGHCWRSKLGKSVAYSEGKSSGQTSTLLLFEDHQYLGPADSRQQHIEKIGRGWYRHDGDVVYFSTPDNTDPNTNGRAYSYSMSKWLHARSSGVANNVLRRDFSPAAIAADVEYAIQGVKYQNACEQVGIDNLQGKQILELGPGPACAWALLLVCRGATVSVVDPYPAVWDEEYHSRFFATLRDRLDATPGVDTRPLDALLGSGTFSQTVLRRCVDPVEEMELPDESFDIVFSNAVGEHFYDCAAAFEQLSRVTKSGGWGFHWIDFRDHRDFTRPLEYLLMSDGEFAREFGLRRGEIGNRLRANEMCAVIEQSGFEIVAREPTIRIEQAYLADFLPRLRTANESRYRETGESELIVLGEFIVCRLP